MSFSIVSIGPCASPSSAQLPTIKEPRVSAESQTKGSYRRLIYTLWSTLLMNFHFIWESSLRVYNPELTGCDELSWHLSGDSISFNSCTGPLEQSVIRESNWFRMSVLKLLKWFCAEAGVSCPPVVGRASVCVVVPVSALLIRETRKPREILMAKQTVRQSETRQTNNSVFVDFIVDCDEVASGSDSACGDQSKTNT